MAIDAPGRRGHDRDLAGIGGGGGRAATGGEAGAGGEVTGVREGAR
jgi:hypothetical protein